METLTKAQQEHPNGVFHLIRVGHSSTFEGGMLAAITPDNLYGETFADKPVGSEVW